MRWAKKWAWLLAAVLLAVALGLLPVRENPPVGTVWLGRLADGTAVIVEWRDTLEKLGSTVSISGPDWPESWANVDLQMPQANGTVSVRVQASCKSDDGTSPPSGTLTWTWEDRELRTAMVTLPNRAEEAVSFSQVARIFEENKTSGFASGKGSFVSFLELGGAVYANAYLEMCDAEWREAARVDEEGRSWRNSMRAKTFRWGWGNVWQNISGKDFRGRFNGVVTMRYIKEHLHGMGRSYLSLRSENYEYNGGAHGFGWTSGTNFLRTPQGEIRRISSLTEVFGRNDTAWKNNLSALVQEDLQRQEASWPEEGEVSEESLFSIESSGLRFWFPPYSVGAYVEGAFSVLVPWEKVAPLLPPNSPLWPVLKEEMRAGEE